MIVLILLAFAGMLAGIFLLLGMTPFEFAEDLTKAFASREVPISKRIGQLNHPREAKGIQKTVREGLQVCRPLRPFSVPGDYGRGDLHCDSKLFYASGAGGWHGADPILVCPVHLSQLQKADEQ